MNLGMENETTEHKRSTAELTAAMESAAAILNKHGHGELYFGVRPRDGEVVGMDVSEKTLRDVSQAFTSKIEPRVYPTVERLATDDGKSYIKVVFAGDDRPYACEGRYRIRSADEDLPMSVAMLEGMMLERAARKSPWDGRPSGKRVEDAVRGVAERIVEAGRRRDRIPEPYSDDAAAVRGLGLVAEDGTLTNAGALLLCRGGSPFRLTMGAVAGNDRAATILDLRQEDGPVFDLVERAEHFVMSNIRRRLVFGTGVAREEVPEIPRAAVREAIVNAFCHRDWTDPSAVVIDVFTDTVRVTNPGLFPEGKPPKAFVDGTAAPSRPRNPGLTSALYKAGYIETYGSGIRRIRDLCAEAGVRFSYRQEHDCTSIAFERPGSQVEGETDDAMSIRDRVLLLLSDGDSHSSREVSDALGISRRSVQRALGSLAEDGLVVREGNARQSRWHKA